MGGLQRLSERTEEQLKRLDVDHKAHSESLVSLQKQLQEATEGGLLRLSECTEEQLKRLDVDHKAHSEACDVPACPTTTTSTTATNVTTAEKEEHELEK